MSKFKVGDRIVIRPNPSVDEVFRHKHGVITRITDYAIHFALDQPVRVRSGMTGKSWSTSNEDNLDFEDENL
jgi:hypothetical protein